jgi:hypothetical protein
METNPEKRHKARFKHQSAISVEEFNNGAQRDAKMFNYNDNGLYFEADFDIQPGTELYIGIDNPPYTHEPDVYENYRATIAWQNKLEKSAYSFGYGVKFTETVVNKIPAEESSRGDRKHPRKSCSVPIGYTSSNQDFQGIIKNISSGGLFIKSDHPIAVGKKLKLSIPSKKKAKLVKLDGKVVRSGPNGFGVEFEGKSEK